jgi:hypothetical protein
VSSLSCALPAAAKLGANSGAVPYRHSAAPVEAGSLLLSH